MLRENFPAQVFGTMVSTALASYIFFEVCCPSNVSAAVTGGASIFMNNSLDFCIPENNTLFPGALWSPPCPNADPKNPVESSLCPIKQNNNDIPLTADLQGRTLRVGSYHRPPFQIFNHSTSTDGSGITFEILKLLQKKFNFKYEIVRSDNGQQGIIDKLKKKEIDMSGALIEQTSDLIGKVNFSTALGESFYSILVQRPTQTHKSDALLAPFDTTVWILILVSLALMGPLAFLLILFRAYICRGHPMLGKIFTLGDCVWFSYGALLKQGSVLRPMNDSARVIFMTWWLFITVICAFYTANLTAFLTLAKYELPIKSLADLESKPHYRWKAPKGSALQSLIENVNENSTFYGLSLTLDKNFKHFDETEDPRNMLDNVASENTVYLDSIDVLQYFIVSDYRRRRNEFNMSEEDSCRFRYAETEIENHLFSLAYPLGSNLTKLFDPYLSQMLRGGLVDHWRIKDVPDADICSLAKGFQERSLNLNDLYSTFLIIITGYCSGTFLFILENMRRCFCKKDPHRVSNLSALINKLSLKSVYSQYPRGIRSARDSARPRTRRLSQFHNNLAASRVSRLGTSTISNSVEPHGGPDWHLDYAYSEPLFSFTTGPKGERRQLHGAALSSAASRKLGGTLTSLRDPSAAASRKFAATFTNNSLSGTMTDMEFQREGVGQGKTNDAAPEIKTINGRQYTIVRVDGVVRAIPRK